jgi:putative transposase
MAATPKVSWPWVKTLLHSVYDQPDAASVHTQYDRLVDAVASKLPKVAEHLDAARAVVLAFTSFPREIWQQIWSDNPQVIWSPRGAVLHVDHEGVKGRVLPGGRGYLPLSITRIFRRNHACSAGAVARLVA